MSMGEGLMVSKEPGRERCVPNVRNPEQSIFLQARMRTQDTLAWHSVTQNPINEGSAPG